MLLAFGVVAMCSATALGSGRLMPALAAAVDAGTMLSERSPGARGSVGLTKTKSQPRLDVRPIARVLPRIRAARPPASAALPILPPALPTVADVIAPIAPISDVAFPGPAVFAAGGPGAFGGPGFFGFVPSFGGGGFVIGGGGGGGTLPPPVVDVPPPPPAPIPEPATWAMMIIGFGVVGACLRRRPRRYSHV